MLENVDSEVQKTEGGVRVPPLKAARCNTWARSLTQCQVKSTVFPALPSLASRACALSARLRRRLFAYSVAPLVSVVGDVMPLPVGPRLLNEPGIGGGAGAWYTCPVLGSTPCKPGGGGVG